MDELGMTGLEKPYGRRQLVPFLSPEAGADQLR